ncbi:MAG: hypothetical protein WCD37_20615 [Chloroflexia bacterium]
MLDQLAPPIISDLVPEPTTDERPSTVRRLPSLVIHLGVLAAFVLLTTVATWPMLPQLGGYVIDKGDPLYSVWAMAWQAHSLATDPSHFFDANIMYPFRGTLAFDELSFTEAVLAAPLYWLTGNPVLSHNTLLFLTFVLSGYGMWLLVRHITGNGWAGLVAGAAFAFCFYRLNHLPHQTLINVQWVPFILLASYKLLWTRRWRWAWALGALFTVQALSGHYLAFYTALLLGLFFAYYFLFERRLFAWRVVGQVATAMGVSALIMLPIIVPYVTLQGGQEFSRGIFEAERFSNTLSSFLAVYRANPILQGVLAPFADPGPWSIERAAFPGLFTLVLALVGVFGCSHKVPSLEQAPLSAISLRKHALFYAIIALLTAILSLGPSLQLTYAANNYDPAAIQRIMPLPYYLLHEWVPGFQSMRVVTRIGVLTAFALAVLAGIGAFYVLRWLAARWERSNSRRWLVPVAAVVLMLLPVAESWSAPISMQPVGTRAAVPPVYRWLGEQPHTVIAEYPMVYYKPGDPNVEMANLYQYYSVYHWHDTINASTSIRPFSYSAVVLETTDCFPCPRSLDVLRMLDVEYVAVHLDNLSAPQRTDFEWRSTNPAAKVMDDFVQVEDFGPDRVYYLKPRGVSELANVIPPGASILLGSPGKDPIISGNASALVSGGYMAALGWLLRDRPQYGDPRLSFGQAISPSDPEVRPDYAILWARDDPLLYGYNPGNRVWSNEFVSVYRRGASSGHATEVQSTP